jgi:hypothetical protein
VPVTREELVRERRPVDQNTPAAGVIGEGEESLDLVFPSQNRPGTWFTAKRDGDGFVSAPT